MTKSNTKQNSRVCAHKEVYLGKIIEPSFSNDPRCFDIEIICKDCSAHLEGRVVQVK